MAVIDGLVAALIHRDHVRKYFFHFLRNQSRGALRTEVIFRVLIDIPVVGDWLQLNQFVEHR